LAPSTGDSGGVTHTDILSLLLFFFALLGGDHGHHRRLLSSLLFTDDNSAAEFRPLSQFSPAEGRVAGQSITADEAPGARAPGRVRRAPPAPGLPVVEGARAEAMQQLVLLAVPALVLCCLSTPAGAAASTPPLECSAVEEQPSWPIFHAMNNVTRDPASGKLVMEKLNDANAIGYYKGIYHVMMQVRTLSPPR
jgi:hypothetical protein